MAFIDEGGYQRAELWLSDGWAMVQGQGIEAPLYWERVGSAPSGSWTVFTLEGPQPVIPADPVCHISYYEADAYARWAGARLATEAEWESVAAARVPATATSTLPPAAQTFEALSLDEPQLHPRAAQAGALPSGVWEWTASAYLPYPGYRSPAGAIGEYNGKFMVNQHVLRGGACITPAGHTRLTYRNFFPPPARWPFTGARLARDLQ
jgi:ergothioneine biosynthesis protein EgtB